MIFTVPVLMLLGQPVPYGVLTGATIVGAALGVLFILPLRRQMIELDRLRFPTGTAVAQILRSPGAGLRKSALLGAGVIASAALSSLIGLPRLWPALPQLLPETVDLGRLLGLPGYMSHVWALSALSLGAGFLSGRAGLVVLLGGVLANWLLSPVLVRLRWAPPDGTVLFREINRPLGIGMLLGGALVGVAMAVPLLRGALAGLGRRGAGTSDELGLRSFVGAGLVGLLALWGLAQVGSAGLPPGQAALVALVGVVYIALSGIIIAQCTGLTDWSPMSGMALIAVSLIMLLSGHHVAVSVACGAACCVAMAQAADMMTDLKTGHLVGTRPRLQQLAQLSVAWMGPPVALGTLHLVARAYGLGTDRVPAPQAQALQAAMLGLLGGQAPVDRYLAGALLGGLLTAALGGGLGVMVGLSMYIPFQYILPYGLGCLLAMWAERRLGGRWCQDTGLPLAAGLIVGDSLAGVTLALLQVGRGLGAVVP